MSALYPYFKDFTRPDGTLDDEAHRAAVKKYKADRVAIGADCMKCGRYTTILGNPPGHATRCFDCKELVENDQEVSHDDTIRCPHCGHEEDVVHCENGDLYEEGAHDVYCGSCDKEYEIETQVSHSFTSPARSKPESGDDSDTSLAAERSKP